MVRLIKTCMEAAFAATDRTEKKQRICSLNLHCEQWMMMMAGDDNDDDDDSDDIDDE